MKIKTSKISRYALRGILNFPLVILNALVGSLALIAYVQENSDKTFQDSSFYLVNIALAAGFGVPFLFALGLYGKRIRNPIANFFLQTGGALLVAVVYFSLPKTLEAYDLLILYRLAIPSLCAILLCSFILFIGVRQDNAFWQFNRACLEALFFSSLYTVLLFIGTCLALYSLRYLFPLSIGDQAFVQVFLFYFGVINVWYFLSLLPIHPDALEEEDRYPKNLKFITQYALIPLISLYGLILYAYGLEILFQWSLPKGSIAALITAFSALGIIAIFLTHPLRKQESKRWVNFFKNAFYIALLPLLVLLLTALGKRIEEYGFTENRYFLVVLAIWLSGIALYFIRKQDGRLIYLPTSLFACLLLASLIPHYNAFSVSQQSQISQLEALLHQSGVLAADTIGRKAVAQDTLKDVQRILSYLNKRDKLSAVLHYFGQRGKEVTREKGAFNNDKVPGLMALFARKSKVHMEKYFHVNTPEVALKGFQYLIPVHRARSQSPDAPGQSPALKDRSLQLSFQRHPIRVPLGKALLQLHHRFFQSENPLDSLVLPYADSRYTAELRIQDLTLNTFDRDSLSVVELNGYFLLKKSDSSANHSFKSLESKPF